MLGPRSKNSGLFPSPTPQPTRPVPQGVHEWVVNRLKINDELFRHILQVLHSFMASYHMALCFWHLCYDQIAGVIKKK